MEEVSAHTIAIEAQARCVNEAGFESGIVTFQARDRVRSMNRSWRKEALGPHPRPRRKTQTRRLDSRKNRKHKLSSVDLLRHQIASTFPPEKPKFDVCFDVASRARELLELQRQRFEDLRCMHEIRVDLADNKPLGVSEGMASRRTRDNERDLIEAVAFLENRRKAAISRVLDERDQEAIRKANANIVQKAREDVELKEAFALPDMTEKTKKKYNPGPRPASAREIRRQMRDGSRSGKQNYGNKIVFNNNSMSWGRVQRPKSAVAAALSNIRPVVRNKEQNTRKQRQRMFKRELEWQRCYPYKPPLLRCIKSDRLIFKRDKASTPATSNFVSDSDFQTGNFGTDFDKVRRMKLRAAAEANSLWLDGKKQKRSPDGHVIAADGEVIDVGSIKYIREGEDLEKTSHTPALSIRGDTSDIRKRPHPIHGYFRPASATRQVQGTWGTKVLDLEGLSRELPRDCLGEVKSKAMISSANDMEKMVRDLKFEPRVVNKRNPWAGKLKVNTDYMNAKPT